jgi:hypothetical protein
MPSISLQKFAATASAFLLSTVVVACGPPDEEDRAHSGPINGPFVVSKHFTPSGLMGDGAIPGRVTVDINNSGCKKPRPPGAQGDCYRYTYLVGDVKWAGSYWVFPSNNWGTVPGRSLNGPVATGKYHPVTGAELRGYHYVRFSAALDLPGLQYLPDGTWKKPDGTTSLPPSVNFWAGRLDGAKAKPPQPYSDVGCRLLSMGEPTCLDTTVTPATPFKFAPTENSDRFTPEWVQYRIDLTRWSVESVIGAFGFSTNDNDFPAQTQVLYFDDIVWE